MSPQPRRLTLAAKSFSLATRNHSFYSVLSNVMENSSVTNLEQDICRFVADMLDCQCSPHDDLKKLGLDSIAFLELVIFIEKRCQIPLPLELMAAAPMITVSALVERLLSPGPLREGPPSP